MSDTDNPIRAVPDPIALITKAGKLNLTSVGSDEYEAYHTGKESGMFDVESGLHDAAA